MTEQQNLVSHPQLAASSNSWFMVSYFKETQASLFVKMLQNIVRNMIKFPGICVVI